MVNLIKNNFNNPPQLIQELINNYPNKAKHINGLIGQGHDPMALVMSMLNMR